MELLVVWRFNDDKIKTMKKLSEFIREENATQFVDAFITFESKILCLRRANYLKFNRGKWCLPGGSIDKGEKPFDAILREVKEETNISLISFETAPATNHTYDNGKSTTIFRFELDEFPEEIKISKEHAQYKWLTIEEIKNMKEKFPPETYDIIIQIAS